MQNNIGFEIQANNRLRICAILSLTFDGTTVAEMGLLAEKSGFCCGKKGDREEVPGFEE